MAADGLVGSWKLVAWQVVAGDQARDVFGTEPTGFLLLTREGRAMVLTVAAGRQAGESDTERAALHRSMVSYTGRYRVEGDEFITTVEASWNESWTGTEQRRRFRIEGNRLFIESARAPSIVSPGTIDYRRIVWEREPDS